MCGSAAVLSAAIVLLSAVPDDVKLKDGTQYRNLKLVKETPTHCTFADLDDRKVTIAKDQIEAWEKKPTIRDELKGRIKATAPTDAATLWEIAGWAKAQGLPKDAREVMELVIKADPEHAEARAALDFVKLEGAWVPKKEVAAKLEAAKGEQLKALGYKLEGGQWVSPAEASRAKLKLVQAGRYWVTPADRKTIEAKGLEFREGEWLSKEDLARFDAGQRKVGGQWKPMLDADEAHRAAKDPWVLQGAYVELRSNLAYAKTKAAFKSADDAVNAAVALSGVEPDVWAGKSGLLRVYLEKDLDAYKARAQGQAAGSDWSAVRSGDGVFYNTGGGKVGGASYTYFHDEDYVRWWAGRGGFEAYVGRIADITRIDQVLLDAFAAYFGSFSGEKYHPSSSSRFLFDRSKAMRPASKMFEGFKRANTEGAELHFRQLGFFVHFLVKRNPEGARSAVQKFLAGKLGYPKLVEEVLGKVEPAALDKEYEEAWIKFRDAFRP
jgi:hypothetical protein